MSAQTASTSSLFATTGWPQLAPAMEPVAVALRDHRAQLTDWKYAGLAPELHFWVGTLDLEFELQLVRTNSPGVAKLHLADRPLLERHAGRAVTPSRRCRSTLRAPP